MAVAWGLSSDVVDSGMVLAAPELTGLVQFVEHSRRCKHTASMERNAHHHRSLVRDTALLGGGRAVAAAAGRFGARRYHHDTALCGDRSRSPGGMASTPYRSE